MANGTSDEKVINVTEEQIARTYALGFLGAAGSNSESLLGDLVAIRDEVLAAHPKLGEVLSSAFLDHEQRVAILDRLLGGRVAGTVLNFLKVLSQHERIGILGTVINQVESIFNEENNRVDVLVRLAHETEPHVMGEIEQTIRTKMGVEPILRVEVDPELVGGFEMRVGDTVYDGSVRTAFAKAHKMIVEQTIEAIETQPERFTVTD